MQQSQGMIGKCLAQLEKGGMSLSLQTSISQQATCGLPRELGEPEDSCLQGDLVAPMLAIRTLVWDFSS